MQARQGPTGRVVAVESLAAFFQESMQRALERQQVSVHDQTAHYVVNLLTLFSRSEALHAQDCEGRRMRPLALMLADAMEAPSDEERSFLLQRLGDVALFIAGFFADSLSHRAVDVDYYIRMGGGAYGSLSDQVRGTRRGRAFAPVFGELAEKFQPIVDVLNDVSESARGHNSRDVLRLYELWIRTGSRRARSLLRDLGIEPTREAVTRFQH